jgi:hypothetical protein
MHKNNIKKKKKKKRSNKPVESNERSFPGFVFVCVAILSNNTLLYIKPAKAPLT